MSGKQKWEPLNPYWICFLYVKRNDILTAKNKTNSNERELVPRMGKEIRKLLKINSLDLDKLHLRTLIKLASQRANHYGLSGRLEKCSWDFQKEK